MLYEIDEGTVYRRAIICTLEGPDNVSLREIYNKWKIDNVGKSPDNCCYITHENVKEVEKILDDYLFKLQMNCSTRKFIIYLENNGFTVIEPVTFKINNYNIE